MIDHVKRLETVFTFDGIGPEDKLFVSPFRREFVIYTRSVTLFGRFIWPDRFVMTADLTDTSTTESGVMSVRMSLRPAGPIVRERASWLMLTAWYVVGLPIWWITQRRS